MYVQNEIVVKQIHMFSYFETSDYPDCNLIFDNFFILRNHPTHYFGYLYSQCYRLNIKLKGVGLNVYVKPLLRGGLCNQILSRNLLP